MAIGASSQHTLCPGDEIGKPQLTRVRSMVLYCYFQSLAVANQAPNFNNYAAINREYNKLIVIVCELISGEEAKKKREKSSQAKIIIVIGRKPMFSAVLRKVDALSWNFDGHSRHSGFLKIRSQLNCAKYRKNVKT